jgi:N-acetylmuramoyl-L-alanine amidase
MRKINKIILHCSATKEGKSFTAADIDRWHREQGYAMIGYHYVILLDGTVEIGRPPEMAGAHTYGHNDDSIGICYIGGLDMNGKPYDTRTPQQRKAMQQLIDTLREVYPNATVHGHREFANKDCPCFEVASPDEGLMT